MHDLERYRALVDSRPTRFGEAVNRYLGAVGHRPEQPVAMPARAGEVIGVVLVGADESPASYSAVDHAAIEAELRGWDLRILHVQRSGGRQQTTRETGARLLERLAARVHACSPSVAVTRRLAVGSPAHLLLAEGRNATLVVVGHRHGGAGTAFGLSVGDRVAAQHPGPVLVVRVPGWPPGPGFGERPIVLAAERADLNTPSAVFALAEARVRRCDLVVLRAHPDGAAVGRTDTVEGVRVHYRTVPADPVTALIDVSNRAAAIVLGRRGAAGSPVALLGSVSRAALQRAYCPVFLVD
ncbi:universal stress protein [Paractinoplanes rishiriensis]|uniref:UspA domain-containing protein n=1 Tax=Paractinoplanes rishiriensis TaxID=1050105 RepID=A0A919KD32_9ACTN|nr:universal stress protein [Actinoplanes rishiriensis]GIF01757.1 hypothetical protein Ari01nite_92210 [Actinoplanes rishiriensis]